MDVGTGKTQSVMTVVHQERAGGVRAIVATALQKKRFYSQTRPALAADIRVTKGRENETP